MLARAPDRRPATMHEGEFLQYKTGVNSFGYVDWSRMVRVKNGVELASGDGLVCGLATGAIVVVGVWLVVESS